MKGKVIDQRGNLSAQEEDFEKLAAQMFLLNEAPPVVVDETVPAGALAAAYDHGFCTHIAVRTQQERDMLEISLRNFLDNMLS